MKSEWDEVSDIVYTGTQVQIDRLKCPECDGKLTVEYRHGAKVLTIRCNGCGAVQQENGADEPAFYKSK